MFSLWAYSFVLRYPPSSRGYMLVVVTGMFISSLVLLVRSFLKERKFDFGAIAACLQHIEWSRIFLCIALSVCYVAALRPVGYLVSSLFFMILLMWVLGTKKPIVVIAVSFGVTFGLFYVFQSLLGVPLPAGFLRGIL